MEKVSAACAMDWSIELEKALRSKVPGRSAEAILQLGPRLQQWSRELEPTLAAHQMFGLIPGEDRLFANSILLRLADAFRLGDEHTRLCVVKVFLSEYRRRDRRRGKGYAGLLSKAVLHNQLELLNRVKVVFDDGGVMSRAMALVLFGCWGVIAKDNAHIRYVVLSSLVSPHVLEVRSVGSSSCCLSFSYFFPMLFPGFESEVHM